MRKHRLLHTLVLATLFTLLPVQAGTSDVLDKITIYRGNVRENIVSGSDKQRDVYRRFVIFDKEYAQCATIDFGRFGGLRRYRVRMTQTLDQLSFAPITQKDSVFGIRMEAEDADIDSRYTVSSFFHGRTGRANVQTGLAVRVVKKFKGNANILLEDTVATSSVGQEKFKLRFSKGLTKAANNQSDDFATAVARVITELENRGYQAL